MLARRTSGFTLIELMITVAMVAIIAALAAPSFRDWILKASVKTAAESFQNGVRIAQAAALSRNGNVEIILTSAIPVATNYNATPLSTGPNWMVRVVGASANTDYIAGFNSADGASTVTVKSSANTLRFGGFGRAMDSSNATLAADYWVLFKDTTINYSLCVYATPGGAVRMCDPSQSTGPTACVALNLTTQCI